MKRWQTLCFFSENDFPAFIPVPSCLTQYKILHCAHHSSLPIQGSREPSNRAFHYKSQHICEVWLNWNMRFCMFALKAQHLVQMFNVLYSYNAIPLKLYIWYLNMEIKIWMKTLHYNTLYSLYQTFFGYFAFVCFFWFP